MAGTPDRPGAWAPLAEQDLADIWRYYAKVLQLTLPTVRLPQSRLLLRVSSNGRPPDARVPT
jgi:hypothetical protein